MTVKIWTYRKDMKFLEWVDLYNAISEYFGTSNVKLIARNADGGRVIKFNMINY